ncbi:MAG: protein kinase [Oligosphaeraceae bacterium]
MSKAEKDSDAVLIREKVVEAMNRTLKDSDGELQDAINQTQHLTQTEEFSHTSPVLEEEGGRQGKNSRTARNVPQDFTQAISPEDLALREEEARKRRERRKASSTHLANDSTRQILNPSQTQTQAALEGLHSHLKTVILFVQNKLNRKEEDPSSSLTLKPEDKEDSLPDIDLEEIQEDPSSPQLDERYELLRKFAKGGQGIVSKARDKLLRRIVAIKSLRPELLSREAIRKNFLQEALITAQLDHPTVVPIYAIMQDTKEGLHLSMKLLQGETLHEYLDRVEENAKRGAASQWSFNARVKNDLSTFLKICEGISYAHNRHIIHCDLKPDNIMLGKYGEVYIMDWGLARLVHKGQDTPPPGGKIKLDGTPRFIPPEAYAGVPRDERADIFALGLILFEMVTLRPGYDGGSIKEVVRQVRAGDRNPVAHRFGFRIRRDLVAIIEKACAYDPSDRYQTVQEFTEDLQHFLNDEETDALPDNYPRWFSRYLRHNIKMVMILALAGWVSALLVSLRSLQKQEKRNQDSLLQSQNTVETLQQENLRQQYLELCGSITDANCNNSQRIAFQLQSYANHLQFLALQAATCLQNPPQSGTGGGLPVHAVPDFPQKESVYSSVLERNIGLDFCTYFVPEEQSAEKARQEVAQLKPLTPLLQHLVLASNYPSLVIPPEITPQELRKQCTDMGMPIIQAYIATEESHVQLCYPGHNTYRQSYDNHDRLWYQLARKNVSMRNYEPVLGLPYLDDTTGFVVLNCTVPIVGKGGEFLGACSLKMKVEAFEQLIRQTSEVQDYELEYWLIAKDGRRIFHKPLNQLFSRDRYLAATEEVPETHVPPTIQTIYNNLFQTGKANYFGSQEYLENGYRVTYHYATLERLGLYLILKTSKERLLQRLAYPTLALRPPEKNPPPAFVTYPEAWQ